MRAALLVAVTMILLAIVILMVPGQGLRASWEGALIRPIRRNRDFLEIFGFFACIGPGDPDIVCVVQ